MHPEKTSAVPATCEHAGSIPATSTKYNPGRSWRCSKCGHRSVFQVTKNETITQICRCCCDKPPTSFTN